MTLHLPSLNACLNAISAILLTVGFVAIKKKNIRLHTLCMMGALMASIAFLVSYLYYHYHFGSTKFTGGGTIRTLYMFILLVHTVLATVIIPFVITTVIHAIKGRFDKHAKVARWTWPMWMTVSVTGVIVYLMLYQM